LQRLIFPEIFRGRVKAFFTGKDPGADLAEVARILRIKKEDIYLPIQKHTDKIFLLESSPEPKVADAVVTKEAGVLIGVQVADCVPVLIYEKEKGIIGAVHAGWRGTAAGILKKTIVMIMERYVCGPGGFYVAVGPSIKGCSYVVDHEVNDAVIKATGEGDYYSKKGKKYFLDLPLANKYQALSLGIPEPNIWVSDDCTYCNPHKFYSYRYARGSTGRQAAFIGKLK
jgi:YfiH family protein